MNNIEINPKHYPIFNKINNETINKTYKEIMEKMYKIQNKYDVKIDTIPKSNTEKTQKDQNVGLILWYENSEGTIEILTGIETHYLTETFNPNKPHTQEIIKIIKNYETIEFPCSSNKIANQIFKERAKKLSEIFEIPVTYESIPTPSLTNPTYQKYSQIHNNNIQIYQTHYRIIKTPNDPKYGIIKGKIENGESPIQAMLREIEEELKLPFKLITSKKMYLLPSKKIHRFQNSILHTYHCQLSEYEYLLLKQWIKENKPEGEMMEFGFRPIHQLKHRNKTNAKTAEHIKSFYKIIAPIL